MRKRSRRKIEEGANFHDRLAGFDRYADVPRGGKYVDKDRQRDKGDSNTYNRREQRSIRGTKDILNRWEHYVANEYGFEPNSNKLIRWATIAAASGLPLAEWAKKEERALYMLANKFLQIPEIDRATWSLSNRDMDLIHPGYLSDTAGINSFPRSEDEIKKILNKQITETQGKNKMNKISKINESTEDLEIRVYIADLNEYNAGRLTGKWFELDDYNDEYELEEAIEDMLVGDNEVFAIHDYEAPAGIKIGEYEKLETLFELKDGIEEGGETLLNYVEATGYEFGYCLEHYADAFVGTYESNREFAEETFKLNYQDIPGEVYNYIDFEKYYNELMMDMSEANGFYYDTVNKYN